MIETLLNLLRQHTNDKLLSKWIMIIKQEKWSNNNNNDWPRINKLWPAPGAPCYCVFWIPNFGRDLILVVLFVMNSARETNSASASVKDHLWDRWVHKFAYLNSFVTFSRIVSYNVASYGSCYVYPYCFLCLKNINRNVVNQKGIMKYASSPEYSSNAQGGAAFTSRCNEKGGGRKQRYLLVGVRQCDTIVLRSKAPRTDVLAALCSQRCAHWGTTLVSPQRHDS